MFKRTCQAGQQHRWRAGLLAVSAATLATAVSASAGASSPPGSALPASAPPGPDRLAPQPLSEPATVTVLMSGRVEAFLGVLLADEFGEFEREGIDVGIEFIPATESPILVATGRADVAMSNLSAGNMNLIADGNPLRVVFGGSQPAADAQEGFWVNTSVLGDDGFQPSDLEGATLATSFGAASSVVATLIDDANQVEPGSLTVDSFEHQTMSLPDSMTALMNGAVDAAMSVQPFSTQLAADGCCEYIGMWPTFSTSAVLMGPNLLEERREVGLAFTRAVARTIRDHLVGDYHKDPELSPVVAELLEQPLDVLQGSFSPRWDIAVSPDSLTVPQDYFFEIGELLSYDTPLTPDQVFDLEFLVELGVSEAP